MKYAKIDKGNGIEVLVAFRNIQERHEQGIMFPYEFPEGKFSIMDYPQARREFGFRSTSDIKHPCELCGGKTFMAAFHAEDVFHMVCGYAEHRECRGVA